MATNTITSNLTSIKAVIAYAHDDLHNKKALTQENFSDKGLSAQQFEQWVAYVEQLRETCVVYNKLAEKKSSSAKEIQAAEGQVWSAWRAVLKEGTEDEYNKNFFVRKTDATKIANWASLTTIDTAVGRQFANKGKADFRKSIETLIGIRMTGNGVLDDDKRDVITAYESAVKTIQRNKEALEDSKDKSGKPVAGLISLATLAEKNLAEEKAFLEELGVAEDKIAKRLERFEKAVADANAAVADANKEIAKAEKTKAEKEAEYNKTIALLNSVGDYQ